MLPAFVFSARIIAKTSSTHIAESSTTFAIDIVTSSHFLYPNEAVRTLLIVSLPHLLVMLINDTCLLMEQFHAFWTVRASTSIALLTVLTHVDMPLAVYFITGSYMTILLHIFILFILFYFIQNLFRKLCHQKRILIKLFSAIRVRAKDFRKS